MRTDLDHLFLRYIASSFDKQNYLSDLIGDADWHFELSTAIITFGKNYHWEIQLIGTESDLSSSWLWAWANEDCGIPKPHLGSALTMQFYGEAQGIPELTEPEVALDRIDSHTIAMIACGVCRANAYYRCPYDGGALYVLIMDENFPKDPTLPLTRLATVFPQAISSLDIPDHRLALTGYLDYQALPYEEASDTIIVRENGEPALTATFDHLNRLTKLETTIKPGAEA